jgi:uncharacterized protein YihD (DUF1040 family)
MRDPKRIDVLLEALRNAWQQDPDIRLGQLVVNATRPSSPCPEVFHIEDEALLEGLHRYIAVRRSGSESQSS